MTELEPCPFCGGEAKLMHMDLDSIEEGWQVWGVWCVDDLHAEESGGYQHGHCIDNYATADEAIAAWNTRSDYAVQAANERRAEQAAEYWKRMYEETFAERTCRIVKTPSDSDFSNDWRYRCSECGCNIPVNERDPETGDVINAANYCPNCGRKVVDA